MTPDPVELIIEDDPAPEHVQALTDGLVAYNSAQVDADRPEPLAVFLRVHGQILAGAEGHTHWRWLRVNRLWVDGTVRRQGAGRQVMTRMEEAARRRGCQAAWLDTFSFQALGFYQRLGYRLFGELTDYPPGHARHFLSKPLDRKLP